MKRTISNILGAICVIAIFAGCVEGPDGRLTSWTLICLAVAAVCVLAIGFLGLCAWAGMALVRPSEKEGTELPTHLVTHDSMCATTTYDGELIRWYVMVDPDYRIQYLVNDRGGCCVRLDSDGNVMGVSDDETEEEEAYEWE
jgi:hypothetical protein